MSESIGYGPPVPLTGGTMTGALSVPSLTSTGTTTLQGDVTYSTQTIITSTNGATWTRGQTSEILSVSTSATTDTAGSLLPANAEIKSVVVRVLQAIPTAATFTVGDATTAARFATGVLVAANTTTVGITQIGSTGVAASTPIQAAAAKVRITPNLAPATSTGQLRITVFYEVFVAPTS